MKVLPPPKALLARAQNLCAWLTILFLLSWAAPLLILAAPMMARTYLHMWKVVLGIEKDCAYPAPAFSWGDPDCADPSPVIGKRTDKLPPQEGR